MFPKLITLKKGNFMKLTPSLRNRSSSASRGYNHSNIQHGVRHKKNIFKKSIVVFNILLLLLCLCFYQFSYYGKADEPIVVEIPIIPEKYAAIWSFGDSPNDFNITEATIADKEVVLRSYNYNWNQTSKKDFDKGEKDNVTVTQKSIIEEIRSWDFESGEEGWDHGIITGGMDEWQHGNISEIPEFIGPRDSGSYVWGTNLGGKYDDNFGTARDYYLSSPNINLANSENTELRFWHYYDFENDTNAMDGGRVEISIDDGFPWVPISPILGYDSLIESDSNPLFDKASFAGNSSMWVEERFDISQYDGSSNFSIRFRFATDGQGSDYGWYIDDIEIISTTSSDGEVEMSSRNIEIGKSPNNVKQRPENMTIIDPNNPLDHDGILTEWTVFIANITQPAKGQMKIFREEEGEFKFIKETDFEEVVTGKNTFSCFLEDVKAGDYIGWYGMNASIFAVLTDSPSAFYREGNIAWDSLSSSWTPLNFTISISAKGIFRNTIGSLTSQVFDAGSSAIWEEISWVEDLPILEVDIVLQTRTGNSSNTEHSSWSDWSSFLSENKGSEINSPNARYIQFKATLTTSQQLYTPWLNDVSIFYKKFSPYGEVVTNNDLIPGVTHEPLDGRVVQWLEFSKDEIRNGQNIGYSYSLDSGETWHPIPVDGDLTSVSVFEGKIRVKVSLSTKDTTISPVVRQIGLNYSSATPDMWVFIEADKNDVKPGDTISYTIYYDNKGIGDAKDVIITLELDTNVSYIEDNSPVPSTIEEGNIRKWHFDIVNPGKRSFIVYAKVKELSEDASISSLAVLNYTDLGGYPYLEVNSTGSTIKVMVEQDLLPYYIALGAIIIIISFALLTWHRYRVLREAEKIILIEDIEKGIGYLIMEENPSKSYGVFSDLIDEGYSGLCITRTFPGRVISNYSFEGVTILWLSRARDENSILPTNLSALLRSAKDFLEANEEAVILLDGLEYLMVHNDFQRVLKMVHGLNELTAINDARLIIPLNPVALDKEKLAILKRDLKMLG